MGKEDDPSLLAKANFQVRDDKLQRVRLMLEVFAGFFAHQSVQKLRASLHCRIKRWLSKQEGGRHIQASLRKEARAREN